MFVCYAYVSGTSVSPVLYARSGNSRLSTKSTLFIDILLIQLDLGTANALPCKPLKVHWPISSELPSLLPIVSLARTRSWSTWPALPLAPSDHAASGLSRNKLRQPVGVYRAERFQFQGPSRGTSTLIEWQLDCQGIPERLYLPLVDRLFRHTILLYYPVYLFIGQAHINTLNYIICSN